MTNCLPLWRPVARVAEICPRSGLSWFSLSPTKPTAHERKPRRAKRTIIVTKLSLHTIYDGVFLLKSRTENSCSHQDQFTGWVRIQVDLPYSTFCVGDGWTLFTASRRTCSDFYNLRLTVHEQKIQPITRAHNNFILSFLSRRILCSDTHAPTGGWSSRRNYQKHSLTRSRLFMTIVPTSPLKTAF